MLSMSVLFGWNLQWRSVAAMLMSMPCNRQFTMALAHSHFFACMCVKGSVCVNTHSQCQVGQVQEVMMVVRHLKRVTAADLYVTYSCNIEHNVTCCSIVASRFCWHMLIKPVAISCAQTAHCWLLTLLSPSTFADLVHVGSCGNGERTSTTASCHAELLCTSGKTSLLLMLPAIDDRGGLDFPPFCF